MFKMIFRVAIAFAVVWMLVPHGDSVGLLRPGFNFARTYFGWPHTDGDVKTLPLLALVKSAGVGLSGPARDCVSPAAVKTRGPNRSAAAPPCPVHAKRHSDAEPD